MKLRRKPVEERYADQINRYLLTKIICGYSEKCFGSFFCSLFKGCTISSIIMKDQLPSRENSKMAKLALRDKNHKTDTFCKPPQLSVIGLFWKWLFMPIWPMFYQMCLVTAILSIEYILSLFLVNFEDLVNILCPKIGFCRLVVFG